ncbi:phage holin [Planococcus plakortidis]
MTADKIKQVIAAVGGVLSALYLFFQAIDVELAHFNEMTIEAFIGFLTALIPLILIGYGIWKNQYLVTKKAKEQEEALKRARLK